jgi:hypothetical protein
LFIFIFLVILTRRGVEYTLDQVPRLPRNFIYRAVHALQSFEDKSILRLCRRLITVAFNGGIPVHLLDWLKIANPSSDPIENFASKDFARGVVNLTRQYADLDVDHFIFNFKNHLLNSASEADFRSLFWDGIISKFFYDISGKEMDNDGINFRLSSEWSTKTLLDDKSSHFDSHRIVDFVSLIRIGAEVPILLVEMGNKPFLEMHKDFSKLLSLVSATCIKMAHMLIARKQIPELARTYGIWIGGAQFQFCVAVPVISESKNFPGKYEIHANISFFPHWKFDLLSSFNSGVECQEICCSLLEENEFETIIPGEFTDDRIEDEQSFKSFQNYFDLEEEVEEEEATASHKKLKSTFEIAPGSPERIPQPVIEPSTPENQIAGYIPKDVPLNFLYNGDFNVSALGKLKSFIEVIKNRIDLIFSDNTSGMEGRGRNFVDPPDIYMLPASLKDGAAPNTDKKSRVGVSSQPFEQVTMTIEKNSQAEKKTRQKLAPFICFPRVFSSKSTESGGIEYEMELMESMINYDSGRLCDQLLGDTFELTLVKYLRFGLHVLYGLHTLHTVTDLVHSDISFRNIMYSSIDGFWKINDFDQTMNIEESKSLSRIAGTPGFIAPESQKSGIFTPQSDIFALGNIFFNFFYPNLLSFEDEVEEDSLEENLLFKFERIMLAMKHADPSRRPSALKALKLLYSLFKEHVEDINDDFLISTCIKYLIESSDKPQSIQPSELLPRTEFVSKISQVVEHEDPHLKSISNVPQ